MPARDRVAATFSPNGRAGPVNGVDMRSVARCFAEWSKQPVEPRAAARRAAYSAFTPTMERTT